MERGHGLNGFQWRGTIPRNPSRFPNLRFPKALGPWLGRRDRKEPIDMWQTY